MSNPNYTPIQTMPNTVPYKRNGTKARVTPSKLPPTMSDYRAKLSSSRWREIRDLWESGMPTKEIAQRFDFSAGQIALRARTDGWIRDPNMMLQASAYKREKFEVAVSAATGVPVRELSDIIDEARDLEDHDLQAVIIHLHRKHVTKFRDLAEKLYQELSEATIGKPLLEEVAGGLALAMKDPKAVEKLDKVYEKMMSLPSRIDSLKKLAETAKIIVAIERESFGLKPIDYDDKAKLAAKAAVEAVTEGFDTIRGKFRQIIDQPPMKDITPDENDKLSG